MVLKDNKKRSRAKSLNESWLQGTIPEHHRELQYPIDLARHILKLGEWTEDETRKAGETLEKALLALANMHLGPWIEDQSFPGGGRVKLQTPRSDPEVRQALTEISMNLEIIGGQLGRMLQHPTFVNEIKQCTDAELFAVLVLSEAVAGNELGTWRYATGMLDLLFIGYLQKNQMSDRFEETGRKIHRGLKRGREMSAIARRDRRYLDETMYREMAIEIMKKNPGWTLDDIAKEIRVRTGEKRAVGTIKNAIKGIKTAIHKTRDEND